jgi:hypothetical protein
MPISLTSVFERNYTSEVPIFLGTRPLRSSQMLVNSEAPVSWDRVSYNVARFSV